MMIRRGVAVPLAACLLASLECARSEDHVVRSCQQLAKQHPSIFRHCMQGTKSIIGNPRKCSRAAGYLKHLGIG
jgi:hypothetical protein